MVCSLAWEKHQQKGGHSSKPLTTSFSARSRQNNRLVPWHQWESFEMMSIFLQASTPRHPSLRVLETPTLHALFRKSMVSSSSASWSTLKVHCVWTRRTWTWTMSAIFALLFSPFDLKIATDTSTDISSLKTQWHLCCQPWTLPRHQQISGKSDIPTWLPCHLSLYTMMKRVCRHKAMLVFKVCHCDFIMAHCVPVDHCDKRCNKASVFCFWLVLSFCSFVFRRWTVIQRQHDTFAISFFCQRYYKCGCHDYCHLAFCHLSLHARPQILSFSMFMFFDVSPTEPQVSWKATILCVDIAVVFPDIQYVAT